MRGPEPSMAPTAALVGAVVFLIAVSQCAHAAEGVDKHAGKTQYAKGTLITPDSYDPDPRVECSHGVHFFITRAEAEAL